MKQHRKERKELQAKIQGLKKTASKGDKKKKKEVNEEIAKLEQDLDARHEQELNDFKSSATTEDSSNANTADVDQVADQVQAVGISEERKVSKAQKRRDKKAEKEKQRLEDIERQEEENKLGARHLETQKIKELLAKRGLKVHEIPSDGDCLFAGVSHQMANGQSVQELRQSCTRVLRDQREDFQPFLGLTESEYEDYCAKMESTPKWGGQIELSALANALKRPIEVVQAEGPPVKIGEENQGQPLILTYHRHYYGLGEHYNSTTTLS